MRILRIYPCDPCGKKIGGIETCIREMNENSPPDIEIELVGIKEDSQSFEIGEWQKVELNNRTINFLPVMSLRDINRRCFIPLLLQFTFALLIYRRKIDFKNRTIVFHRLEPAFVLGNISEEKIYISHGDIRDVRNSKGESRWKYLSFLYFFIEKFFIKQFKIIFVVSQTGCDYYKKRYPDIHSRFRFLPTWYNEKVFYLQDALRINENKKRYNLENKRPVIIFVGRLENQKDPFLLIKSFFIITNTFSNSTLLIVGEGSLENDIRNELGWLGISDRVIFMGRKTSTEIADLLNISDLMLLASAFEGMPRVVIEALACGIPVVCTNTGSVNLVVKEHISGVVVDSRNAEDIARSVNMIMQEYPNKESCRNSVNEYSQKTVIEYFYKTIKE